MTLECRWVWLGVGVLSFTLILFNLGIILAHTFLPRTHPAFPAKQAPDLLQLCFARAALVTRSRICQRLHQRSARHGFFKGCQA